MRVLFLTNFYPPHALGGYELWCHEVATALSARGHALYVVTSRHGIEPGVIAVPNVKRVLHLMTAIEYYRPIDFFARWRTEESENKVALEDAVQTFQPDVAMVWGMWNLSLNLPFRLEQLLPGRVAYFVSSYWPADTDPHTEYWNLPARRTLMAAAKAPLRRLALRQLRNAGYPPRLQFQHVVCCSEYVRQTLVEAGELPMDAGVLLGGTDPAPFLRHQRVPQATSAAPIQLLYFGRLIYDKGVHTAIEALGLLRKQGKLDKVQLTILGSGHPDYEEHLHREVVALGIAAHVTFIRQVPREEIPAWLGRFDIYLFTSIWAEPMARSVMEAMASGLLVVGTTVGGQAEMLIDGQNALTFHAGDAEELAAQIARAQADPALQQRLALAGQQMVLERFTLARMVNDIESFLLDIVHDVPDRLACG